jgi:hypothetical protein
MTREKVAADPVDEISARHEHKQLVPAGLPAGAQVGWRPPRRLGHHPVAGNCLLTTHA